jgi:branched-chain amino acid transport system ATP-binding protein
MPETAKFLRVRDLNAFYGESHVLHGMSFEVGKAETVALLGRNGAGKTTTLKSVMGLVEKRTGSIIMRGSELVDLKPYIIARLGVTYCPEERGIFSSLSVGENLSLPPAIGAGAASIDDIFALFPQLRERQSSQGTKLSGGEQQMLAIGRMLVTGARLLLIDEPTEGLAPVIVAQIGDILRGLREKGYTLLLVEQNLKFVSTIADRFLIVENGRVVDAFDSTSFQTNVAKVEAYLGV